MSVQESIERSYPDQLELTSPAGRIGQIRVGGKYDTICNPVEKPTYEERVAEIESALASTPIPSRD